MTIYLKQSTASQEVALGYFVDSTDGNTEKTALTIANTDIRLHKAGATTLANPSAGATHISNGIYYWVADATDSNTLGPMVVYCHPTGALAVRVECCVLAANVYDSLIGGGDLLDVSTAQWLGSAPSALISGRVDVSLGAIGSSTTALTAFKSAVQGNVIGTIGSGSTTTSLVTSSVTPATSVTDQLKGRIVTFKDDTTTAALRGQSTDITGSTASATPTLTVTALTTAAVSGDTFTVT